LPLPRRKVFEVAADSSLKIEFFAGGGSSVPKNP